MRLTVLFADWTAAHVVRAKARLTRSLMEQLTLVVAVANESKRGAPRIATLAKEIRVLYRSLSRKLSGVTWRRASTIDHSGRVVPRDPRHGVDILASRGS
jgi:hypothetical protein